MTNQKVAGDFPKSKSAILQMIDVKKSFGDKKVLDGITFEVEEGTFTCICGPSGCGKSTIINILAGYLEADGGQCKFQGQPITGPDVNRLVVFQETGLFFWMSLWDNVLFGPRNQGKDLRVTKQKARELIEMSGLLGFEKKYPPQLSGGMQRRAELIRALINDPKVLLLDEPFRGLDAMTRELMQAHFVKVFEETKTTMVLITSELDEAVYMGDKVYFLSTIPTTVKKQMPIPISRPRDFKQLASKEFSELVVEAYETMEAESMKTFLTIKREVDKKKLFEDEI